MKARACKFLALAGLAATAHAAPEDAQLKSRLALEPGFSILHRGGSTDAVFTIRNTSATPIEFCLVDGGVSLEVRVSDGLTQPLVVYTIVMHEQCHSRQRLAAGKAMTLRQEVDAPRADLEPPRDAVQMKACLRVKWPDRATPEAEGYLCSSEFRVTLRP